MVRLLFFVLVLGHAGVHAVMWTLPFTDAVEEMPFDPAHSWWLGDQRVAAVVLASFVAVLYVIAGAGWLAETSWWPPAMIGASTLSLLLMALFFAPWWLVGIVLSVGLAVYGVRARA